MNRLRWTSVLCAATFLSCSGMTPAPQVDESQSLVIHVDQNCRIVMQDPENPSKLHFQRDQFVCHLTARHDSQHWEENTDPNGKPLHELVSIHEQEYLLHNTMNVPVTFLVAQIAPEGWQIDSDPQPVEMQGQSAIFRVEAQPRQTVRLHVGVRS